MLLGGEEQNKDHSNVVDDVLNMQTDQNVGVVGDFGHSNVLDESDIGIETECVKKMKRGQYQE